jgi:hypothetical protein
MNTRAHHADLLLADSLLDVLDRALSFDNDDRAHEHNVLQLARARIIDVAEKLEPRPAPRRATTGRPHDERLSARSPARP